MPKEKPDRPNGEIVVPEYKTDGQLPPVCCDTCPFSFLPPGMPKDFPHVECHHASPIGFPIPVKSNVVNRLGQQGDPQMGSVSVWPPVQRGEVCGAHPLFEQHENWKTKMPAGQGMKG